MRRLDAWVLAGLVAGAGPPALAAAEARNVLVVYSNGRLLPANVEGDRGLHEAVRAPTEHPVQLFYEFLDAPRFEGEAYERVLAAYLREKYASRPPTVIVAVSEEALGFLLRHRQALFPRVPVVHAGSTGRSSARRARSPPT